MAKYKRFKGAVKGKGGWDHYKRGFTPGRRASLKKAQMVANRNRARAARPVGTTTGTNTSPSYGLAKSRYAGSGYKKNAGGHSPQYRGYLDVQKRQRAEKRKKQNESIMAGAAIVGIVGAGAVGGLMVYKGNQMAQQYVAKVKGNAAGDVMASAKDQAEHATGAVTHAVDVSPDIKGEKIASTTVQTLIPPKTHPSNTNATESGGTVDVATPVKDSPTPKASDWADVGVIKKGSPVKKGNLQPVGYSKYQLPPSGGFGGWTHAEVEAEYGIYTADRVKGKQIKQAVKAESTAGTKAKKEESVGKPADAKPAASKKKQPAKTSTGPAGKSTTEATVDVDLISPDTPTSTKDTPKKRLSDEKVQALRSKVNRDAVAQATRRSLGADKIAARISGDAAEQQTSADLRRFLSGKQIHGPAAGMDKYQMNPKKVLKANVSGPWMPVGAGEVLKNQQMHKANHPVWKALHAANTAGGKPTAATAAWKIVLNSWATKR